MTIDYSKYDWYENGRVNWYKFSNFGRELNKEGKHLEFIEIYESLRDIEFNSYCKEAYAWALFNSTIDSNISYENEYEVIKKILDNCEQQPHENEFKTPYVFSIIKFIKKMKRDQKLNSKIAFELLNRLNPDILSTDSKKLTSSEGKDYVSVSSQEFYYAMMVKTSTSLEKYDLAVSIGESALEKISKWNYKNDLWIKSRMLYSKCRLGKNFEEDIREFIDFSLLQNQWYFYSKVSDLLFRQNRIDESIEYAAKAITAGTQNDKDVMVKVFYNLALMIKNSNEELAKKLFGITYLIRKINEWSIDHNLKFHIKIYQITENDNVSFKNLQKELISYSKKNYGIIEKIDVERNFGFIKSNDGRSYYFRIDKKNINKAKKNAEVYFDIYYDKSKRKFSAVNLIFKEGNIKWQK